MEEIQWGSSHEKIMSAKEAWFEAKRDEMLEIADEADWNTFPVECDDEGDDWWKYKTEYYWAKDKIFEEYWHICPDTTMIYNALLSSLKDGALGQQMLERMWQRAKRMEKLYKISKDKGRPKDEE